MREVPWTEIDILLIIGILEFIFAVVVLRRYQKTPSIIAFAALAFSASGWVFTNALLLMPVSNFWVDFSGRITYGFAAFLMAFLYFFAINYPYPIERYSRRILFLYALPPLLLTAFALFTNSIVGTFQDTTWRGSNIGSGYTIYAAYIVLFWALSLRALLQNRKRAEGYQRNIILYLFYAFLLSGLFGIVNNLLFPYIFDDPQGWIGSGSSIIWLGISGWVIFRRYE